MTYTLWVYFCNGGKFIFHMVTMSLMERIRQLELIEKDIAGAINSAGQALQELSKDKPGNKHVETHTTNFLKTLEGVETGLTKQINYLTQVSTGQPHEGSNYAAQKDIQMAFHRLEHVKSRLNELEKLNMEHTRPRPPGVGARSFSLPQTDHMT